MSERLVFKTPPKAIVAMAENRGIGLNGKIPWHLPEDLKWFKRRTLGGTLVMGRKTYDSIGRPLPGRRTIVLSRTTPEIPGVTAVRDINALPEALGDEAAVWVVGGAEIYRLLLPYCDELFLTRVKGTPESDTFLPPFEEAFRLVEVMEESARYRIERFIAPVD